MSSIEIVDARAEDHVIVIELLDSCGLPTSDLEPAGHPFMSDRPRSATRVDRRWFVSTLDIPAVRNSHAPFRNAEAIMKKSKTVSTNCGVTSWQGSYSCCLRHLFSSLRWLCASAVTHGH
jgi:hypothetical protein